MPHRAPLISDIKMVTGFILGGRAKGWLAPALLPLCAEQRKALVRHWIVQEETTTRFKDSLLMARPTHAVVLGAGMAGMLASAMLARHFDGVTVLDRDLLPAEPMLRKGVPQARHAHLLWSGGARIMESLLPGITRQLLGAGARRASVHQDVISLSAFGWQHRFPATEFMITCSRALLDHAIRAKVLGHPKITLLEGTEPVDLSGDLTRVTGVLARGTTSGAVTATDADLVVDATA